MEVWQPLNITQSLFLKGICKGENHFEQTATTLCVLNSESINIRYFLLLVRMVLLFVPQVHYCGQINVMLQEQPHCVALTGPEKEAISSPSHVSVNPFRYGGVNTHSKLVKYRKQSQFRTGCSIC